MVKLVKEFHLSVEEIDEDFPKFDEFYCGEACSLEHFSTFVQGLRKKALEDCNDSLAAIVDSFVKRVFSDLEICSTFAGKIVLKIVFTTG